MRKTGQVFLYVFVMILCVICLLPGCRKQEMKPGESAFSEAEISGETADGGEDAAEDADASEELREEENVQEMGSIFVYVCGQVVKPGVYELTSGDRVTHAILAAGGMKDAAADDWLNQAAILEDGQKIYVPSEEEVKKLREEGGADPKGTGADAVPEGAGDSEGDKVNLNTADKNRLMTLSGVGASRADAILSYREEHGGFKSIEEIKKIEGIKDGIFNKIKDKITVQ